MKAVAYIRVSSRDQGFATQRDAIARGAAARGDVIADWWREKRSGKTLAPRAGPAPA
jgi:DNA invertase Pin-like site-specific DNA recombinase